MKNNGPLLPEDLYDIDPDSMDVPGLRALLSRLDDLYENQQALEPDDEESDEYAEWEEFLEDIDDLIDDIRDRLDEME